MNPELYRGFEIHPDLAGYGYVAHEPNYDGGPCLHDWTVDGVKAEIDMKVEDDADEPANLFDATAAERRRLARIAELDALIAMAEAFGETHDNLDGARDWYRPVPFDKLAYEAGYDPTEYRGEQSGSVIAWLEGYDAEIKRDRSINTSKAA